MFSTIRNYIQLTKPTIVFLFAFTGLATLFLLKHVEVKQALVIVCGLVLTAASANAFNQYLERDLDAKMERTRSKRPIPQGKISPRRAFLFSLLLGILAISLFTLATNLLATGLALATILFYVFVYTLWLKPRTAFNIVIGGAAGSTAPMIAWAAVEGRLSVLPILLFLIIFIWTPPHFWALSLCIKEQYKKVGIPMLPIVYGEDYTRGQIFLYSMILFALTLLVFPVAQTSLLYFVLSVLLGGLFVWKAMQTMRKKTVAHAYLLFGYSIAYLFALFAVLIVEGILN